MKFLVKKQFGKLIPVYNSDAESLKDCKLKENEVYEVDIKRKRNIDFHRKMFALYNLCFDNQEVFDNIDDLRRYLTCKAGFYNRIKTPDGEMIAPKSIQFNKMDNIEFSKLYQATIDAICHFIDVEEADIMNEIVEFI
jgi:hypothetical protein